MDGRIYSRSEPPIMDGKTYRASYAWRGDANCYCKKCGKALHSVLAGNETSVLAQSWQFICDDCYAKEVEQFVKDNESYKREKAKRDFESWRMERLARKAHNKAEWQKTLQGMMANAPSMKHRNRKNKKGKRK